MPPVSGGVIVDEPGDGLTLDGTASVLVLSVVWVFAASTLSDIEKFNLL
jgi:hypothetical protein